jgi:site-specific recombinase XerD
VKGKIAKPFPRTEAVNHILSSAPKNLAPSPYVFINPGSGKNYKANDVVTLWRSAYIEAGISYLKIYDCTRHAFATMMRSGGMDMADIKDLMRHSNIKMTEIYDHSSVVRLARMIDKIMPFPGGNTVGKVLANEKESSNSLKNHGN